MRLTSSRTLLAVALVVLGAFSVAYPGCATGYTVAVVAPPRATSVNDYEVFVINAAGDIRRVPYRKFRDASSVVPFFEKAPAAR